MVAIINVPDNLVFFVGYWRQRADERLGNPPRRNQEPLVVKEKVTRPLGEHWMSKSMECDTFFPSVLWRCWLGDRKGIQPVKGFLLVFHWNYVSIYTQYCFRDIITCSSIMSVRKLWQYKPLLRHNFRSFQMVWWTVNATFFKKITQESFLVLKWPFRIIHGHWKWHRSIENYDFLLTFHRNQGPIFYRFPIKIAG